MSKRIKELGMSMKKAFYSRYFKNVGLIKALSQNAS